MGRRTANQQLQIASGVVTRPLCCDEGREVHLIEVFADDGSKIALAMKYWGPDRLAGGDMTDQVSSCRQLHKAAATRSHVSCSTTHSMTAVPQPSGVGEFQACCCCAQPHVVMLLPLLSQVFNELRARMSILSSCHYTVLPLHVNISKEGGMLMLYPDAGTSMDTVCARVRAAGKAAALETQLAEMATSVLLTLQKLQAQKPKVG